jgi:hypothetical protein
VINVAGFHIKFEKFGKTYKVPNDGLLHVIPDECFFEDNFNGLLRVIVPPQSVKQVLKTIDTPKFDINEPTIKEIIIEKIEEKKSKPLKGVRLSKKVRLENRKTRPNGKKTLVTEESNDTI